MSFLTQREYVIKEVLTTEQDYVADVKLMVDTFHLPLLKKGIISPNESGLSSYLFLSVLILTL
jgi:hypothetical protein